MDRRREAVRGLQDPRTAVAWGACATVLGLGLVFAPIGGDVFVGPKTAVMVVASILLLVGVALAEWRSGRPRDTAIDLLVAYLALWVAATVLSAAPAHSLVGEPRQFQGLIATLCYAVAFVVGRAALGTEGPLRRFSIVLAAAGTVASAYAVVQLAGLDPIWRGELDRGRVFSTLGQANALAAFLVLVIPPAAAVTARARSAWRIVGAIATAAMAFVIVVSMSRGAYLGLAAAGGTAAALAGVRWLDGRRASSDPTRAVDGGDPGGPAARGPTARGSTVGYLTPGRRSRTRRAAILATAVVGVALCVLFATGSAVPGRLATILDTREGSSASHLDTWAVGVRMALDNPLLGVGPEMYPSVFASYRDAVLPADRAAVLARFRPESPHNVPIAIADAAGLVAAALYACLVALAVVRGVRRWRQATPEVALLLGAVIVAVVGHVVTDLFMTAEPAGSWVFWALLGVLAIRVETEVVQSPQAA